MLIGKGKTGDVIEYQGTFRVLVRHASIPGAGSLAGQDAQQWWVASCEPDGSRHGTGETAMILGRVSVDGSIVFDADASWRLVRRDGIPTEN